MRFPSNFYRYERKNWGPFRGELWETPHKNIRLPGRRVLLVKEHLGSNLPNILNNFARKNATPIRTAG